MECNFTFNHYRRIFQLAISKGYKIVSCLDYFKKFKEYNDQKILINRVDIDLSCKKAKMACDIFNDLNIDGSFFVRLHGEYNPFSFTNYLDLRFIRNSLYEIGLHSEIVDCSKFWNSDPEFYLEKDIEVINNMLDYKIRGIASHNGETGNNNLDFWRTHKPMSYGIYYEAYDPILFNNFYTSDSLITKWKCYNHGVEIIGDNRCICDHLQDEHKVIYCLTHPVQYE